MRRVAASLLASALALGAAPAWGQDGPFGCIEGPEVRGGRYDTYLLTRVLSLRPACVRLRFRLDLWQSVDDLAQRGPLDRRLVGEGGLYDAMFREAQRAGAFVILTVGVDAANATASQLGDAAVRSRYAEAIASLAARYRGRLRAIELEGQPNRRAEGDAGVGDRVPASTYAATLIAVQTRLRPLAEALRCEMPEAIVGGIYDGPADRVASGPRAWLQALYEALAADPATAQLRAWGREPVRDLGVQIQEQAHPGRSGDFLADGVGSVLYDLDWLFSNPLRDVPRPRVWITAGSYRAANLSGEDLRQSNEASAYFRTTRRMDLPIRPVVIGWSPVVEPMSACEGFGLFRDCIVDDEHTRDTFGTVGNGLGMNRPEPWSRLEFTDPAVRVAAGGTATVQLRVTNASPERSNPPSWTASSNLFIGQPEGCPMTPAMNNIPWTGLPAGSTPSALAVGARIRFAPANPVPPTASAVVSWTIAPPRDLAPGSWTVAARMLEGDRWFGPWATIPVEVLPPVEMDAGIRDAGGDARADAAPDVRDTAVFVDLVDAATESPADVIVVDGAATDLPMPVAVHREVGGADCGCRSRPVDGTFAGWLVAMATLAHRRRRRDS